jgi:periplasmic mercuric ion binding protein
MRHILFSGLLAFACVSLTTSCGSAPEQAADTAPMLSVDELEVPATLAVTIDGMACPNGCAKPIEKACSKLGGMALSQVSFAEGKGYFTYDAAKLSEADIIACIEATNGGGHYKVTATETQAPNADAEEEIFNSEDESGDTSEEVSI